jgi:hypothetical protein
MNDWWMLIFLALAYGLGFVQAHSLRKRERVKEAEKRLQELKREHEELRAFLESLMKEALK